jgi:hypothetical protein
MKRSPWRFLGCMVGANLEPFALALGATAGLLVGLVSCSKAPEPERNVKMYLDYLGEAGQLHDLWDGPGPGV